MINVTDPGYYLVTSSLGSKLVVQTLGNVTINEKNDKPSVEKTQSMSQDGTYTGSANTLTGSIGDTVYYKINVTIPASANSQITVNDTVSNGLTINTADNAISYSATSKTGTADPVNITDVSFDNDSKKWSQSEAGNGTYSAVITQQTVQALAAKAAAGATVTLTLSYSAKINSNAVIDGNGNTNTATIEYSHFTSTESKVTVKTYEFDIVKTETGDDGKNILNGAQFELYKSSDVTNGAVNSNAKPIKFVKSGNPTLGTGETNQALSAIYKVAEDQTSEIGSNDTRTTTLDAESIRISGLANGTYYLKETKAPAGYNALTELKSITISDANQPATTTAGTKYQNETHSDTDTVKGYTSGGLRVENGKGSVLPSTGGIGTTIFYVAGIALVICAVVVLVNRKHKENA